ncbi:MAG: prepilin peptidase [Clostridiales bacterium]|nr:prepilin peptidase [Clostridiales bacterium]
MLIQIIIAFIFGLLIGSFLNVCIYRIPQNESIVFGSSHCMECKSELKWFELFPLFSYIFLKGKCRTCHTRISIRYPLIELLNGVLFAIAFYRFPSIPQAITIAIFFSILIVISMIDLDTMLIPNRLVAAIFVLGISSIWVFPEVSIFSRLIGSVIISVPFLLIAIFTGGMGGGDVKLMFAAGFLLGIKSIVIAALFGIVIAAICGIIIKIKTKKSKIPFGPYLSIGLAISALVGTAIADWYISLLT